ncbi:SDR family NAD(P)-dependent oxidoreductase [Rhizobium giardinii]|uniref:Meso-butanediol dehydrogenase/(S,S)-butanediol dehydrogenase/diacetyl reductase n=1 Tax=Rhizobium giardinii TaxID=56731 RepID=A0A7W8UC39_9HYPH|nr:SDR family oxidoreductase [Rhizobium giardinii]MBB5535782.1 meso-butanediol dehydrogenase/(S,S)-butanediol dehydrogenase/diacetyl reductase [Rhizobium giardinii]
MISGRTEKRLSEAASKMPAERSGTFVANVSSRPDCDALVAATVKRFGRIDTVVNAAGMNLVGTIEETSDQDWDECIASDLSGVFYMSRAAVPHIKETKGSIVNIGSVSSLGGGWSHAAYNAAKGGVANLTRSAACDLGKFGVRANTVAPGLTVTGMVDAIMDDDELRKGLGPHSIETGGQPEEIASAVAFLASDEAAWITGIVLPVDGGQTCADGGPEWDK